MKGNTNGQTTITTVPNGHGWTATAQSGGETITVWSRRKGDAAHKAEDRARDEQVQDDK